MTAKGSMKEGAGFIKEETGEMLGNEKMADKGRKLRNEGRAADGKPLKTTKPGTGNNE